MANPFSRAVSEDGLIGLRSAAGAGVLLVARACARAQWAGEEGAGMEDGMRDERRLVPGSPRVPPVMAPSAR